MVSINWQFQATIPGGPAVTISQPAISVDAYDVVAVTIHASASNVELPIQPTGTAGKVALLIVNSSLYDTGISFTVDSLTDTTSSTAHHPRGNRTRRPSAQRSVSAKTHLQQHSGQGHQRASGGWPKTLIAP
jgi:hypothetical protein